MNGQDAHDEKTQRREPGARAAQARIHTPTKEGGLKDDGPASPGDVQAASQNQSFVRPDHLPRTVSDCESAEASRGGRSSQSVNPARTTPTGLTRPINGNNKKEGVKMKIMRLLVL